MHDEGHVAELVPASEPLPPLCDDTRHLHVLAGLEGAHEAVPKRHDRLVVGRAARADECCHILPAIVRSSKEPPRSSPSRSAPLDASQDVSVIPNARAKRIQCPNPNEHHPA